MLPDSYVVRMQLVISTARCTSNASAVPYLAHIFPSQIPLLAASPSSFPTFLIENRLSHRHLKSCPVLRTGPQGPRSYSRHSNLGSLDHGELARRIAAALTQGEKLTSADVATLRAKHNTDSNGLSLRTGCNDMFRRRREDLTFAGGPPPPLPLPRKSPPPRPPPRPPLPPRVSLLAYLSSLILTASSLPSMVIPSTMFNALSPDSFSTKSTNP
jgi:hypothetical protein